MESVSSHTHTPSELNHVMS